MRAPTSRTTVDSRIFPSAICLIVIPLTEIFLFVAGFPRSSPRCVPVIVHATTNLSFSLTAQGVTFRDDLVDEFESPFVPDAVVKPSKYFLVS